jgi:hypothetical protein
VTRRENSSISQILKHGESLKYVDAHGIRRFPRSPSTFLHPSAPLRFLRLAFTFLPGECLLELRHFQDTLRQLRLDDVRLSSRSWAEVFNLLQQFSALCRLQVEKCRYQDNQDRWKFIPMTETDQQALLQYKAHRPQTWAKPVRKLRPVRYP